MLKAGATGATSVEASTGYLEAAKEEAERQGHRPRVSYHYGDFVDLARVIEPADVVTLDRVICCYQDMPALVGLSAARARKLYGLVYPRGASWIKLGFALVNLAMRIRRNPFRSYVHPSGAVDAVARGKGLERRLVRRGALWQVVVYARAA